MEKQKQNKKTELLQKHNKKSIDSYKLHQQRRKSSIIGCILRKLINW